MSPEARASGAPDPRPDESLVREWRRAPDSPAGRRAAERLLGRYTARTYAWCLRTVEEPELARDLAQDALLNAWRGLHRFREDAKFSSWLFAIVRNRCRSHLRRPALFEADDDPDARPGSDAGPARRHEEREEQARLVRLMRGALEPVEQEALWLRCIEGLPVDEITRTLDVRGASGARGLLQTARRKLRAALDRAERKETGRE